MIGSTYEIFKNNFFFIYKALIYLGYEKAKQHPTNNIDSYTITES